MPSAVSLSARRNDARPVAARRTGARRRRYAIRFGVVVVLVGTVLVLMPLLRKTVNQFSLPLAYQDVIRAQAADKHLDPALIAAVIYAETKFDPRASSA